MMWQLDHKESWAPKNWCFWTVVLEKTLESPLDCKAIQPVHPKGNTSGYSLEGLMLTLKFQYFGHLMWKTDSLEKILVLEKIEGGRRQGPQRMRWLEGITDLMDMSLWKPVFILKNTLKWVLSLPPIRSRRGFFLTFCHKYLMGFPEQCVWKY